MPDLRELWRVVERNLPQDKLQDYTLLSNLPAQSDLLTLRQTLVEQRILSLSEIPALRTRLIELLSEEIPADELDRLSRPQLALLLNILRDPEVREKPSTPTKSFTLDNRTELQVDSYGRVRIMDLKNERETLLFTDKQSALLRGLISKGGTASYQDLEDIFQEKKEPMINLRVLVNHTHKRYATFLGIKPYRGMLLRTTREGYTIYSGRLTEIEKALEMNQEPEGKWITQELLWDEVTRTIIRLEDGKVKKSTAIMPLEAEFLELFLESPDLEVPIEKLMQLVSFDIEADLDNHYQESFLQTASVYMFHLRRAFADILEIKDKKEIKNLIKLVDDFEGKKYILNL